MKVDNWIDVFQNKELNRALKNKGIVKFNLEHFDARGCEAFLKREVPGYPGDYESQFYGSVSLEEMELKRKIHSTLDEFVTSHVGPMLTNHRLLTYFFLIKGIGNKSILRLHQDWSIVDERKYKAYNLWIPLINSTVANGTIFALPGSHEWPLNIRGAGIPPKYLNHFETAKKFMKPFRVKVGQALIFNSRVLHFSPPNQTTTSRTAVINNIVPLEAEITSFHGRMESNKTVVSEYKVPEDFFIHYDDFNNQKDHHNPMGKLAGEIDYANADLVSEEHFHKLIKSIPKRKKWLFF